MSFAALRADHGRSTRLTRINAARAFVLLGFVLGLNSIFYVMKMVGDPNFLLVSSSSYPPTHSWYIAFREYVGVFATMVAILIALWVPAEHRTRILWWICAVLMFGFYGPFWLGRPFMAALTTPNRWAELSHIVMTVPSVIGLAFAKREYQR